MTAIVAITCATLTACAAPPDAAGTVAISNGKEASVSINGITVDLPEGATTGSGELTVVPQTIDGRQGWDIDLSGGAILTGSAILTFAGAPIKGEPAPLVTYIDDSGKMAAADSVTLTDAEATVATTHFSFWIVTWFNTVVEPVKELWGKFFSGLASEEALRCKDAEALSTAGYRTSGPAEDDERGSWCAGMSAGKPVLGIGNGRHYPMVAVATAGLILQSEDKSLESMISQLFTILGRGTPAGGGSMYALSAGDSATYQVAGSTPQTLTLEANPSAYAAEALKFGADTALLMAEIAGKSLATKAVAAAMGDAACVDGFGKMAGANPQSADAVIDYLNTSLDVVFDCLGPTMKKLFKGDAWLVGFVAGMKWVADGVNLAASAGPAVIDQLTNVGTPYAVQITNKPVEVATIPGLPPELSGRWCSRSNPDSCFDGAEIISKYPDAYVTDGPPIDDTSGVTYYTVCLERDLADGCTMAATLLVGYLPAGTAWNCVQAMVDGFGWPKCDPDFTGSHDPALPRVVIPANHQQDNDAYHDSEPMYLVDE